MNKRGPEDHIGDGVYVEYTGYSVILRANNHLDPTDTIHLNIGIIDKLNEFVSKHHKTDAEKYLDASISIQESSEPVLGYAEGDPCNRSIVCDGLIDNHPVEGCTCQISGMPPCGACTTPREYCAVCDWEAANDE